MKVEIQGRQLDLTSQIRDYVDDKVGRLDRYLPDIHATSVELERENTKSMGEAYVVEITAWVDNAVLRAEEMNPDLFSAIDVASDRMYRQIEKYKGKRLDRWHGKAEPAPVTPVLEEPFEDEDAEAVAEIVRRKQFRVFAMSEGEAVEQLDLLGHDFFVFLNGDTGALNVLYRRKGGDLGIIEPTPA